MPEAHLIISVLCLHLAWHCCFAQSFRWMGLSDYAPSFCVTASSYVRASQALRVSNVRSGGTSCPTAPVVTFAFFG
jgi:ABC-type microcin C transport system permease subunit YejE